MLPLLSKKQQSPRPPRNNNTVAAKSYTNQARELRDMTQKSVVDHNLQNNSILPPSLTSRVTNLLGKINKNEGGANRRGGRNDSYTGTTENSSNFTQEMILQ